MYKKVYVVKDSIIVGSGDEESNSNFEQRIEVDRASDNNDEVIPDGDEVESNTDLGKVVKPAQFEEETSGKYFKELKNISPDEVKIRPSGRKDYGSAMAVPIEQISNRFVRIYVYLRPVQNHAWPILESVNGLHEVLKAYDKDYDPNIWTMIQLSRMSNLKWLLESNHVQDRNIILKPGSAKSKIVTYVWTLGEVYANLVATLREKYYVL